jgi:hypothetical protein
MTRGCRRHRFKLLASRPSELRGSPESSQRSGGGSDRPALHARGHQAGLSLSWVPARRRGSVSRSSLCLKSQAIQSLTPTTFPSSSMSQTRQRSKSVLTAADSFSGASRSGWESVIMSPGVHRQISSSSVASVSPHLASGGKPRRRFRFACQRTSRSPRSRFALSVGHDTAFGSTSMENVGVREARRWDSRTHRAQAGGSPVSSISKPLRAKPASRVTGSSRAFRVGRACAARRCLFGHLGDSDPGQP